MKLLNHRTMGRKGMMLMVEVRSDDIKEALQRIRSDQNTIYLECQTLDKHRATCIVVTKNSPLCRAMSSTKGFCKSCVLTASTNQGSKKKMPAEWRLVLGEDDSLKEFLGKLDKLGFKTVVKDIGGLENSNSLTLEQERSLKIASESGYFKFPRQTSLRKLAELQGISPSTLDEVLRRAEGKVIDNHMGVVGESASRRTDDRS
jgi:predicted DNA binding protein